MNPAKKTLKTSILSVLVVFSMLISSSWAQRLNNWPDMILYNGQVLTMDDDFRTVDALALRNDQIQAVGSSSEILKLSGSNTRQIDLKGKTVIPGFTDSHFRENPRE